MQPDTEIAGCMQQGARIHVFDIKVIINSQKVFNLASHLIPKTFRNVMSCAFSA